MKGLFQLVFFLVVLSILSGLPQNNKDQSNEIHIKPVKPGSRVGHNAPPDQNQIKIGRDDKLRHYFPFMSGYDDSLILKQRPNSSESLSVDDLLRLRPETTKSPYTTLSLNPEQWHSLLNFHFRTTIQPKYLTFFKWMWAALDNGTIDKNHYYPAMFKDKNFKPPLNPQITADIPIPRGWGQMYMYMKQMQHYRKNPTTPKATTWPSDPYVRRAVSRFRRTFPPHYDNYYRWLYENVEDYSGAKRRADFCDQKGIKEFDFSMLLRSTPFRIPPRHRRYFVMVNDVERLLSSTKHHFWRSTTPDLYHWNQQMDKSYLGDQVRTSLKREDFWEQRYQRYYPFTPEPQYDQFYRWFFKENHELNVNERFTAPYPKIIPFAVNPRIHDVTHKNTPYKIPPLYTVLFAFLDDAKINNMTTRLSTWPKFNWEELSEITGRTTTPLPTTPPSTEYPLYTLPRERKRLINEFFNVTMDPWYEPFYEWFYRLQNDRKGLKRRMQAYENLTDFDYSHELSKAKYPVPDKHREIWAYVHAIEHQLGSTGHHYQPSNPYQWTYKYITEPKLIKDLQRWFPHTTVQERHRSYFKFLLDIMTSPEYHKAIITEGLKMRTLDYDDLLKYTPFELPSMEQNRYAYMAEAKRRLDKKWKFTSTTPTLPTTQMLEQNNGFHQSTTKSVTTKVPHTAQKSTKPKRPITTPPTTPPISPEDTNITQEISNRGMLDHMYLPDKVVNYFNKDIPVHLENYYRWLYEIEHEYNNNDTRKYNVACDIYDQLDFTKLFKYTPYPILPDHVYEFVQFREAKRLLKAQYHPTTNKPDQPDEPDPKPAMLDWFRFNIPPKYFEFYKWLFKLHLEKEEYGKIVQLSKKLGTPNTDQLLANTPYPIPEVHLNFWAFIKQGFDKYVENLKNSTVSTSPYQITESYRGYRHRRSVNDEKFNQDHNDHIRFRRSISDNQTTHVQQTTLLSDSQTFSSCITLPSDLNNPSILDLKDYFRFKLKIQPEFELYYKWLYHLHQHPEIYHRLSEIFSWFDMNELINQSTPFPAPETPYMHYSRTAYKDHNIVQKYYTNIVIQPVRRDYYRWLYEREANPVEVGKLLPFYYYKYSNTTKGNSSETSKIGDKKHQIFLQFYFKTSIDEKSIEFYKWLYQNQYTILNDQKINFIDFPANHIPTDHEKNLLNQAIFKVPEKFANYYSYVMSQKSSQSTSTLSPERQSIKYFLENFFSTKLLPEHVSYYNWLFNVTMKPIGPNYESIKNNDINHHHFILNTPFPIPQNHRLHWVYVHNTKPSSCHTSPHPDLQPELTTLKKDDYHEKLQNYFSTTIEMKYIPFYHWFYNVTMDKNRAGARQYAACIEDIGKRDLEKQLSITPFSIPKKYHWFYGYVNAIESLIPSIKQPNVKSTTIKTKYADKLREYFGVNFDEKYELFYHWLYKLKTNKMNKNLWKFNSGIKIYNNTDITATPFPIPYSNRGFYAYWVDLLNKIDQSTTQTETTSYVRIVRNADIAKHFSSNDLNLLQSSSLSTFSSMQCSNIHYCSTCKKTSQRAKREILPTTTSPTQHSTPLRNSSTPHQHRQILQKSTATRGNQDFINEMEHFFSTQIPQRFLQFYNWLYNMHQNTNFHKKQREAWTNLITQSSQILDYKQILENTPFPIPIERQEYFAFVRKMEEQMRSTDHHTKSYIKTSQLHSAPPANLNLSYSTSESEPESMDSHSDTKEHIKNISHPNWHVSQPHKKEHITPTQLSTTSSLKEKLENYFMHKIQPKFERYYEWLYDTHHDNEGFLRRKEMASRVNVTVNYKKLLSKTPFPIPFGEENHFAFIQEMERRLESTNHHAKWFVQRTDSTTGVQKLITSNVSNDEEQKSITEDENNFDKFYKWLSEHDIKSDNTMKNQFLQIKSHKSHYNFSKLLDETPFPIPTTYLEYFAFVHENERRHKYLNEQAAFRSQRSEQAYARKQATRSLNSVQSQSESRTKTYTSRTTVQKPEQFRTTSSLHKPVRVTEQYVDSEYSNSKEETTQKLSSYATKFGQPLVSLSTSLLEKLQNHFVTVIENKYIKYYDWLYKVQNDREGFKRRFEAGSRSNLSKHINLDEELKNTPFPIPPHDEEYFAVIREIERIMGSTDHHAEWYTKSMSETQNESISSRLYTILPMEFLEQYFSIKISPIFHKFYDWLYHLKQDTAGYDKRHQGVRAYTFRSVHPNALKKTPFPVPFTYRKYFAHIKEIEHLIKSSTHHNDWYLPTVIDNTTATHENFPASDFFTPMLSQWLRTRYTREWDGNPIYEKFFLWLSEVQDDREGYRKRLNASKCQYGTGGKNKNGKSSHKTPFPIPVTYQNYFALVNQLEQFIGSTKHHAKWYWSTSEEPSQYFSHGNKIEQFVKSTNHHYWLKRSTPSNTSMALTTTSTPPKPFIRRSSSTTSSHIIDDDRSIYLSESLPSSSDERQNFSSNEFLPEDVLYLDGHKKKPKTAFETSKYRPFYEWLYKMRIEKDIPMLPQIKWHFYKFDESSSTPFPIPEESKHEYAYIKYLEQHDFKTNLPHPTIAKSKILHRFKTTTHQTTKYEIELQKAKSYFPFQWAPQYNKFFTWFYTMIHKKSLRDKTCGKILDTENFELLYLNKTKFPVPSQYYTEYAMMQYMDGLPNDEGIDSEHWRDREAAKKHFYPFRWQSDYDKFYIWLHRMIEKHGKPESTDPEFKHAIDYDHVIQHSSFKIPADQMHDYLYMKWLDDGKKGDYMNPPYATAPPSLLVRVNRFDLEKRAEDYFNLTEKNPYLDYYVWKYEMLQKHDHFNKIDPNFFKNINYLKYITNCPFKIPLGRDKEYCKMRYYDEAFNKDLEKRSFVLKNHQVFHTPVDDDILKEVKHYFRFGWYPYYNQFYVWFYKKIKQHGVFKKIDTESFKNIHYKAHLAITPFLIPPEYLDDYAYMRQLDQDLYVPALTTPMLPEKQSGRRKRHIEVVETSTKPSPKTKTTQLFHKWMNEQYEYHDPYYDKFYEWLIFREDLSPVSGGVTPRRVNPDVIVLQTHPSTPFPIPANFTKYFRWFDDNHTKTSTKFPVAVTGDYMDYVENITKPPVEELIKGYYSMDTHLPTLNTRYHDFYDWYVRKYMGQPHEKPTVDGPVFISPFVPYVKKNSTPFEIPPKFTNYFKWFGGWPQHRRSYRTPDYDLGEEVLLTTPSTWVYFDYNYTTWWPPQEIREREFHSKHPKYFDLPLWKMLLQNKGTSHAPEYDEFYEWFYRKHFEVTHSIEHYSMEEPKLFPIPTPMKYVPKNNTPWKIPWEQTDMMNWVDSEQLPGTTKETDGTILHPFYLTKFYGTDWMVYGEPTVKRYHTSAPLIKRKWTRTRSTTPMVPEPTTQQFSETASVKRKKRAIPANNPIPESIVTECRSIQSISSITPNLEEFDTDSIAETFPICHLKVEALRINIKKNNAQFSLMNFLEEMIISKFQARFDLLSETHPMLNVCNCFPYSIERHYEYFFYRWFYLILYNIKGFMRRLNANLTHSKAVDYEDNLPKTPLQVPHSLAINSTLQNLHHQTRLINFLCHSIQLRKLIEMRSASKTVEKSPRKSFLNLEMCINSTYEEGRIFRISNSYLTSPHYQAKNNTKLLSQNYLKINRKYWDLTEKKDSYKFLRTISLFSNTEIHVNSSKTSHTHEIKCNFSEILQNSSRKFEVDRLVIKKSRKTNNYDANHYRFEILQSARSHLPTTRKKRSVDEENVTGTSEGSTSIIDVLRRMTTMTSKELYDMLDGTLAPERRNYRFSLTYYWEPLPKGQTRPNATFFKKSSNITSATNSSDDASLHSTLQSENSTLNGTSSTTEGLTIDSVTISFNDTTLPTPHGQNSTSNDETLNTTGGITIASVTISSNDTTLPTPHGQNSTSNETSKCRKKRSINPSEISSVENFISSYSRRVKSNEKFVVFSSNETDIFGNQNMGMMADIQGMGGAMGNYYRAVYEDTLQGEIYRRKYLSQSTSTPTTTTSSPADNHTMPEDQRNIKSSLDQYFSTAIHSKYFEAYKWYHAIKQDKEGYKKRLKTSSPVYVDYDLVLKTTPFLLPPHLRNFYAEIREQERAIGSTAHHIHVPIPPTLKETKSYITKSESKRQEEFSTTEYQTTIIKNNDELLTNLENFFKITIDHHYIEFFSWLYELMHFEENPADENLLDFSAPPSEDFDYDISLVNTPFPVPADFSHIFDKIYIHYLTNKNCTAATKRSPRITSTTPLPPPTGLSNEDSDYSYDTPPSLILNSDSDDSKRVRRAIEIILLPQQTTTKRTTKRRTNTTRKFSFKPRSPKSTTINTYDLMVSDIRFKAQHIEEYEKYIKKLGIYFLTTIDPQYADFFQWYYRRIREVTYTPVPPISHPSGTYSQPFFVPFEYTGVFSSLFHPKQLKEIMTTQILDHLFEYYDAHPNFKHRGRKIKIRKNFTWPYQKKLLLLEKKMSSSTTPISKSSLETST